MPSPHGVRCESSHRAGIQSPHGVHGCDQGYQVILGTAAQKFGYTSPPLTGLTDEGKWNTWKSVWLFDQNLDMVTSTLSGVGGPATGDSTAFDVEAVQGGDFFVNNGRRMTLATPPVIVWNGLTNDSFFQSGLALSAKRGVVYTKSLDNYYVYNMETGRLLKTSTTAQIMSSQDAVLSAPVAAPALPWGAYLHGTAWSGPYGSAPTANDVIIVEESLSVRTRADLGTMTTAKLAADDTGVVAGGEIDPRKVPLPDNHARVVKFNPIGQLLWNWTDPAYQRVNAIASNGQRVVISTMKIIDGFFKPVLVLLDADTGAFIMDAPAVGADAGIAIGPDGCVFIATRAEDPVIPLAFRAIWKYDAQLNYVKDAVNLEGGTIAHDIRVVQTL